MLGLFGLIKKELKEQGKLPEKFSDTVYSTESYCINPEGIVSREDAIAADQSGAAYYETPDGWKFYASEGLSLHNIVIGLSEGSNPEFPRTQALHPNAYIRFRTPQKGILTSYLTTQYADGALGGRVCNDWEIVGFNSEQDLLNLTNGTVLSHDGWDQFYSNGKQKTVSVNNEKAFQYYAIHFINNFYNGQPGSDGPYCSMGMTKFYMRMPVSTCINEDGVVDSQSGGNGWKIYTESNAYGEVVNMLNNQINPSYSRWQVVASGTPTADDYEYYAYLKTPQSCKLTSYTTKIVYDSSASNPSLARGRVCIHWQLAGYASEEDMLNRRNGYLLSENYWHTTPIAGNSKQVFLDNNKQFQYYSLRLVKKYSGNNVADAGAVACCMGSTKFYVE